jgi:multicomponent Na+:H+ antiporter subunit G
LGAGLTLATVGLYGMLRMPEVFHQLHAAGLVTGPALILVLLAAVGSGEAEIVTSAALVVLFVLITSPLSGHAIAQAARIRLRASKDLDEDASVSMGSAPRGSRDT